MIQQRCIDGWRKKPACARERSGVTARAMDGSCISNRALREQVALLKRPAAPSSIRWFDPHHTDASG